MAKSKTDHAVAFIKAGISGIPLLGGPISSLIGDYLPSAVKRSISTAIEHFSRRLEELAERIDIESLNKDEFSELFVSCYLVIVRTRQEEKLRAASELLVNLLLRKGDPAKLSYTEIDHFVRCLDFLSIGSIKLLGLAYDFGRKNFPKDFSLKPVRFNFSDLPKLMDGEDVFLLMGLVGSFVDKEPIVGFCSCHHPICLSKFPI